MKMQVPMSWAVPVGLLVVCCGLPCPAQEKSLVKPAAQPEVLNVPVPSSVLAKIGLVHVGSTRGFLEKSLSVGLGSARWLPPFDFIYLIQPPIEFQKKYPGYSVGLRVTFGHDYLPATFSHPLGMSKKDKNYNKGYDSAVVTALGKPFLTRRTEADDAPKAIE